MLYVRRHICAVMAVLTLLGCIAAPQAHAARVPFLVPVIFEHIPREFATIVLQCQIYGPPVTTPGRSGRSIPTLGLPYTTRVPIAGDLRGRIVVGINPPADVWIEPHSSYQCSASLEGYAVYTRSERRSSDYALVARGGISTRGGGPTSFGLPFGTEISDYGGYIPLTPGAPATLTTPREEFSIDVLGALNLHGKCECGCGGDFDAGTAACGPGGGNRIELPVLPFETPKPPQLPTHNLPPAHTRPPLVNVRQPLTFTTNVLRLSAAGAIVQCSSTGLAGWTPCPALPPGYW